MKDITAGFALCGSFCTFSQAIPQIQKLVENDINVIPILSHSSASVDTRFGRADEIALQIEGICDRTIIKTIEDAEPIGPKKMLDILIIAPCTGNTLAKLALGITDTPVTMAAKSHLRNNRPVLIGVSTNDALGASAKNIGYLLNYKNIYFVPMSQDNYEKKPNSIVCDFTKIPEALESALQGKQLQPILGL